MDALEHLLDAAIEGGLEVLPVDTSRLAAELSAMVSAAVYPSSVTTDGHAVYALAGSGLHKKLVVLSRRSDMSSRFQGEMHVVSSQPSPGVADGEATVYLGIYEPGPKNAHALREALPWLKPALIGLRPSIGCGDRLGLATPGHIRAVRACRGAMAPILAQQSIREMARTNRSPQQVMDDAMWGAFQEGWRTGYGADADHLKTTEDIRRCADAGFTFFTFDPGMHVDSQPDIRTLAKFEALPWTELRTTAADLLRRYVRPFNLKGMALAISEAEVRVTMVKYGRAIAHIAGLYRQLVEAMSGRPFEVEISVDETDLPTRPAEHFIVAGELRRLGVDWVSLAPRFVGRFEKGVDYIGDVSAFEADFVQHVSIAEHWGPYKLSIHSGSDKFSLYPVLARAGRGLVHLKTAGTSYLEALRTIAVCEPELFRAIYALARGRYEADRASYHVSAEPQRAPDASILPDQELAGVLDQFDARQMLHVCFGSILSEYGGPIRVALATHEQEHYAHIERHLGRHLASFAETVGGQ